MCKRQLSSLTKHTAITMSDDLPNEENILRYDRMVENALRGVVKEAVEEVMKDGLPEEHHFYITFITDYPGVKIPDYLRDRYPGEMTIVLQFQFYDLDVNDERLQVTLSFNNVPEKLEVPLAAITIFADPSVNFALQFQPMGDENEPDLDPDDEPSTKDDDGEDKGDKKSGEVVSLDNFRKK